MRTNETLVRFAVLLSVGACGRAWGANVGFGPIDPPEFVGGVQTYSISGGSTDSYFGFGDRFSYCSQNQALGIPGPSCAFMSFGLTPTPSLDASVTAFPIDGTGISDNAYRSTASGEMLYFFAVTGPVTGQPIPLQIQTYIQVDYTPATSACCGNTVSTFQYGGYVRLDGSNPGGSFTQAYYAQIGPGWPTGTQFINGYANPNTEYDIALTLATFDLNNGGGAGSSAATAHIFIDPVISFAPGFDSTGYSIIISDGVGNGAASAPEPGTSTLLAGAAALFWAVRTRRTGKPAA